MAWGYIFLSTILMEGEVGDYLVFHDLMIDVVDSGYQNIWYAL